MFGNKQGKSTSTANNSSITSGGVGPFGGGGGPPMFPPGIDFVNDTCPVNIDSSAPCLVGPPFNESSGAWICRTLYDIVTGESDTFSAFVDTHHFLETDDCGCCGSLCPSTDPCTCTCDLPSKPPMMDNNQGNRPPRGGDCGSNFRPPRDDDGNFNSSSFNMTTGVLLQVVGDDKTICVPQNMSSRMNNEPGFFGRFECATTSR